MPLGVYNATELVSSRVMRCYSRVADQWVEVYYSNLWRYSGIDRFM